MSSIRFRQATILDPASVPPYGSEAWAQECKKKLQDAVDRAVGGQLEFDRDLREFWEHQGWKALKNSHGQPFQSFREFAMADRPFGLHLTPYTYKGLMRDIDKSLEEVAEHAEANPLPPAGGTRDQGRQSTLPHKRDADYQVARIARDRPDILERMKAGEYKSIRAAAIDAGIVKPLTPLQEVQRGWKHATLDDKKRIVSWIQDRLQEDQELLEHLDS
jgi:hypothetical protein